jgi:peptidoglycan-N-acetylglucosamine deacetylase
LTLVSGLSRRRRLSPAETAGVAAHAAAVLLAFIDPSLATVPLTLFVLLCLAAPFLPMLPLFLPVIVRGRTGTRSVALTFDDGPDPVTTPGLLDILADRGMPATFFLTGERARRHPDLVDAILRAGHAVGNHSQTHDPLLMLKGTRALRREIASAQATLRERGVEPLVFRPPVGITNPRLRPVLDELGLAAVNWSRRAGDRGNRRVDGLARRILQNLRPDDIILLHDIAPPDPPRRRAFFREVETLLDGLADMGMTVRPLAGLIGKRTMRWI